MPCDAVAEACVACSGLAAALLPACHRQCRETPWLRPAWPWFTTSPPACLSPAGAAGRNGGEGPSAEGCAGPPHSQQQQQEQQQQELEREGAQRPEPMDLGSQTSAGGDAAMSSQQPPSQQQQQHQQQQALGGGVDRRRILGGQANLWTEYVPDAATAEYMLLPRLCAMAEALWWGPARGVGCAAGVGVVLGCVGSGWFRVSNPLGEMRTARWPTRERAPR